MIIDFKLFTDDELAYLRKAFLKGSRIKCPDDVGCVDCPVKDACKIFDGLIDAIVYEQETRELWNMHK